MAEKGISRIARFAVYLVVIVLVNVVSSRLFVRFDLTENGVYSLSRVSREVVSHLKEPLTITVFFTPDLPAPYNAVEQYLKDLLEEYALYANKNFNYRFYSPGAEGEPGEASGADLRRMAADYGITPVQIQVLEKDEVKFKSAYMGLVIVQGDMVERIGAITATDGLEYRLTTSMQRINNKISAFSGMKDKVEVTLYLSRSLASVAPKMGIKDFEAVPGAIEKAVEELNTRLYGTITYKYVDPADRKDMAALAEKYNLLMVSWPDMDAGAVRSGAGVAGLVALYRGKTFTIPVIQAFSVPLFGTQYRLTPVDAVKDALDQSIEALVGINETLGYLADKGTLPLYGQPGLASSIGNFRELASQVYTLKEITLDKGIPEGLGCLLIVRPTQTFSDQDLYEIDQALMRGTNIAVFLDTIVDTSEGDSSSPQGQLTQVNTGLEKLLQHYGVNVKQSLALDMNCFKQRLPRQFGGGEQPVYYAPILKGDQINTQPAFMRNIREIIAYKVSPLAIDKDRLGINGLTATILLRTSDKSWEMDKPAMLNPMFMRPPAETEAMASRPIACMIEGTFPSFFAGNNAPSSSPGKDKGGNGTLPGKDSPSQNRPFEHKGATLKVSRPAKIFVMGSSSMITDNLITEDGTNPNSVFVMNVIDVLNNKEDIAVMRGKVQSINPLSVKDENVRILAKSFNIIGLCILVVAAGIGMWLRTLSRKRRIAEHFRAGGVGS